MRAWLRVALFFCVRCEWVSSCCLLLPKSFSLRHTTISPRGIRFSANKPTNTPQKTRNTPGYGLRSAFAFVVSRFLLVASFFRGVFLIGIRRLNQGVLDSLQIKRQTHHRKRENELVLLWIRKLYEIHNWPY